MNIPYKHNFQTVKEYKKERDRVICQMYQDNQLVTHIARDLCINQETVRNTLKRHGLYDVDRNKVHLNKDRIQRNNTIYKLYQEGLSSLQIAKQLNIGKTNVRTILLKFFNVPKYGTTSLTKWRKHNIDQTFFKTIDTEEKAYWLGFLYADGCITEESVRLDLAKKDLEHLKMFQHTINADTIPLYYREETESYVCVINSKNMVQDLTNNGCFQRKTYTLTFPKLPEQLIRHFMRGYFDGDGCIYQSTDHNQHRPSTFSVIGTYEFISEYQRQLNHMLNKHFTNKLQRTQSDNIVELCLGGKQQIKRIYDNLYKDATVFLTRKHEKFMQIINDN